MRNREPGRPPRAGRGGAGPPTAAGGPYPVPDRFDRANALVSAAPSASFGPSRPPPRRLDGSGAKADETSGSNRTRTGAVRRVRPGAAMGREMRGKLAGRTEDRGRTADRRPHGERHVRGHDHGRLLRGAARYQALRRGPFHDARLPAGGGRSHQPGRPAGAVAGEGARRARGARFAEAAGPPRGSRHRRGGPRGIRSGRPRDAGAPVRRTGGARAPGCGSPIRRPLHVRHEHAAAPLPRPDSGARPRAPSRLLHRSLRVGLVRPGEHDPVQPGRAGVPPPRGEDQRAPGQPADELSGRPIRIGRAHRRPARPAGRRRGGSIR